MPDPVILKDQPLRKFDLAAINKTIDAAVATLKPEDHGAVVVVVDTKEAHLAYVHKMELGNGQLEWTVMATKPWNGPLEAEGQIRYRF